MLSDTGYIWKLNKQTKGYNKINLRGLVEGFDSPLMASGLRVNHTKVLHVED